MNINNIIKLSCKILGFDDLVDVVGTENGDDIQNAKLDILLSCANLAYEEIVTEYIPILVEETVSSDNGLIYFDSFSKPISGIISVKNHSGRNVPYLQSVDHIKLNSQDQVDVVYQTIPEPLEFGDEISVIFPDRVLVYGVVREFYFFQGQSDEALLYEKRFKDSLVSFMRKKSLIKLPKRSWKF